MGSKYMLYVRLKLSARLHIARTKGESMFWKIGTFLKNVSIVNALLHSGASYWSDPPDKYQSSFAPTLL